MERQPALSDLAATLSRLGIEHLYLSEAAHAFATSPKGSSMPSAQPQPRPTAGQPFVRNYPKPDSARRADKARRLLELEEPLRTCQACRLCEGRTNLVYGVGNPDSPLLFIGEGPGRDEDLKGEPFVGRAGQLLTDMITKGMRIKREDVYIANIVKCRPPENRNPMPEEMEACLPNLERQIEIIQPRIIVTLGAVPAKALLKESLGITKLRGNWREHHGIPVMPTLHPAYILRNPPAKRDWWEDIKQVIAFLNNDLTIPVSDHTNPSLF
jgi:DNA polymerase